MQLSRPSGVWKAVETNTIPDGKSGALAALAQPENFLVDLFVLSPTLCLVLFAGCFLSSYLSGAVASLFRAARFFQGPRLVTLFPDGSSTSRATLPR
jgi:hypothetical protein